MDGRHEVLGSREVVSGAGWDVAEWEGRGRVRGTRCEGGVGVYGKFVARSFGRSMVVIIEANL